MSRKKERYGACIDCGVPVKYKGSRCRACSGVARGIEIRRTGCFLGDKNPAWTGGLPKCKECGSQLANRSASFCSDCKSKGSRNPAWKGGFPSCSECGVKLSRRKAVRCRECHARDCSGEKSPSYGIKKTEEQLVKMSAVMKEVWADPNFHSRMLKVRKTQMTNEVVAKINRQLAKREPTDLERRVISIAEKYSLPIKFVGSGKEVKYIAGRCPDFIDTLGKRRLIEVYALYYKLLTFGTEKAYKLKRIATFAKSNYEVMFLNDKEMMDLSDEEISDKIRAFLYL